MSRLSYLKVLGEVYVFTLIIPYTALAVILLFSIISLIGGFFINGVYALLWMSLGQPRSLDLDPLLAIVHSSIRYMRRLTDIVVHLPTDYLSALASLHTPGPVILSFVFVGLALVLEHYMAERLARHSPPNSVDAVAPHAKPATMVAPLVLLSLLIPYATAVNPYIGFRLAVASLVSMVLVPLFIRLMMCDKECVFIYFVIGIGFYAWICTILELLVPVRAGVFLSAIVLTIFPIMWLASSITYLIETRRYMKTVGIDLPVKKLLRIR